MDITTLQQLRALYEQPRERAVRKQLAALDPHCRSFIGLSPFVVLATGGSSGWLDASPRGGAPGFVKVTAQGELLVPDSPGNNRLDSLENIVATGQVGMLFMIPGLDETLRVNGRASLSTDDQHVALCRDERRSPKLVIRVAVHEAYLHCAKAFLRSRLWDAKAQVPRSALPTMGQMINDQTGIQTPAETYEEMVRRYQPDL